MSEERPFVFLNAAMTADGKIDTAERQGASISSASDWERVDRLRAESDAIMVGGHTLLGDDPKLTVKSSLLRAERVARGLPENPIKAGVISEIEDPQTGPTFQEVSRFVTVGPARRVIFTTEQTAPAQLDRLRALGLEVFVMGQRRVDLPAALHQLYLMGVKRLMVEGGAILQCRAATPGLHRRNLPLHCPAHLRRRYRPTLIGGPGFTRDSAIKLQLLDIEKIAEGGILVRYSPF